MSDIPNPVSRPIPTTRFGRTGLIVPTISLGTWAHGGENLAGTHEVGWSGHDDEAARMALSLAHARGITHWDTADVYGNGRSEELIGQMWSRGVKREDIVLASKVGWYRGDFPHFYHPALVRQQLEASLTRLRTDHIDIYYLHHCDFGPDDRWLDPALEVIREAQKAGKIRFIGLSDWDDHAIMRVIARVDPDVVQPYRNVTHDHFHESGLAAWCDHHDLGVAFFSPLRHGLLLGKYTQPTTFPHGDFRNTDPGFRDANTLRRLAENAAALSRRFGDRNPEPVIAALVAACLSDVRNATVLLGQRHVGQVEAAAMAADLRLELEELAWVRSLYFGIPS
jgi:aryl-alcohol dehydrogenase-like predicted oxidoreductase